MDLEGIAALVFSLLDMFYAQSSPFACYITKKLKHVTFTINFFLTIHFQAVRDQMKNRWDSLKRMFTHNNNGHILFFRINFLHCGVGQSTIAWILVGSVFGSSNKYAYCIQAESAAMTLMALMDHVLFPKLHHKEEPTEVTCPTILASHKAAHTKPWHWHQPCIRVETLDRQERAYQEAEAANRIYYKRERERERERDIWQGPKITVAKEIVTMYTILTHIAQLISIGEARINEYRSASAIEE
ncbi:hypothetical protein ACJX0J_015596, partial [Zea mays]